MGEEQRAARLLVALVVVVVEVVYPEQVVLVVVVEVLGVRIHCALCFFQILTSLVQCPPRLAA